MHAASSSGPRAGRQRCSRYVSHRR
jgi:hypothetical protein